jgi:hypothetical protein
MRAYLKNNMCGMVQVVECLLSKHEALSSNPSTFKTNKKQNSISEESFKLQTFKDPWSPTVLGFQDPVKLEVKYMKNF